MAATLTITFKRYPPKFWVLLGAMFIDRLGSTMVLPFFSLYITEKFDVGMTRAGVVLGLFALSGFLGSMIGGALTDRFGRRTIVIIGMIASAFTSIAFGVVNEFSVFYILVIIVGLPSNMAGPAYNAMVADILPKKQHAEGYGMIRIVRNLAWVIGPGIGGLLIGYSYLYIFIGDAIASLIVAWVFYKIMPETNPKQISGEAPESLLRSFLGYFKVAKDVLFLAFTVAMFFSGLAYRQIYSTLSVFLRDVHGVSESSFGYLLTANALLVVLAQFWVATKVRRRKKMPMLALGAFLYMIGLGMYGLVSTYPLFLVAMLIITGGEMVISPVSQAMTARFAPEHMRARYMAFLGLASLLPNAIGPGAAGLILENLNPNLLWYLCSASCLVAIGMFLALDRKIESRLKALPYGMG
jgi:MFS family permease